MNKEIYVNELSLAGQFRDWEDFFKKNKLLVKTIEWLIKHKWLIYKKSTLYECKITKDKVLYQLREFKSTSNPEDRDLLLKFKRILVTIEDNPPYWDEKGCETASHQYVYNGKNVSSSSIAQACKNNRMVLSFNLDEYKNTVLIITKDGNENTEVFSTYSLDHLIHILYQKKVVSVEQYICIKYSNTKLDFSKLEEEFGFDSLEKNEINDYIDSFDRFVQHDNWENLTKDRKLNYKPYNPSEKKENWFKGTEYEMRNIYKFRCGNPKRCFGYREGEKFYVLRFERDHRISDKG